MKRWIGYVSFMRLLIAVVALTLVAPATAPAATVDINGAHTTNSLGECHPDDGKTCTYIVSKWAPETGSTAVLPFQGRGKITRLKMPFSGRATIWVRVVREAPGSTGARRSYRIVRSSGPFSVGKGWLDARLQLRVRAGDTIAISVRGENGPYVVYGEGGHKLNGNGELLYGTSAWRLGYVDHLCCGGEELDGLSMVLRFRSG